MCVCGDMYNGRFKVIWKMYMNKINLIMQIRREYHTNEKIIHVFSTGNALFTTY